MRINYMNDVAKLLGIELDKEFDIEPLYMGAYEFAENYCCLSYKLTKYGLYNFRDEEDSKVLSLLLTGEVKAIKRD